MLRLVIVGKKAGKNMEKLINQHLDNVDVLVSPTIQDFCETANLRSLKVDRLIVIADAFDESTKDDFLISFNNYIGDLYPATPMVTLLRAEKDLERFARIFISPMHIHVSTNGLSPKNLLDLVSKKPNEIRSKYGYEPKQDAVESIDEIVDLTEPEAVDSQDNKKGGFLGKLFGKKGGKKDTRQDVRQEPRQEGFGTDVPIGQQFIQHSKQGVQPQEEPAPVDMEHFDAFPDFESTSSGDGFGDFNVQSTNVVTGFEDLDGTPVTNPQTPKHSEFPEDEVEVPFGDWGKFPNDAGVTEPEAESGFDLIGDIAEPTVPNEPEDNTSDFFTNIEERKRKFDSAIEDVTNRELPSADIDSRPSIEDLDNNISIEDIEIAPLVLHDLETLEQEYSASTKVVERVVERVVQKSDRMVARPPENGISRKVYPTGVRILIFTGDRKTGVTKTAMTAAHFYAKTEEVLYVDFDVKRNGSLVYFGIMNVMREDEKRHNGVLTLRSTAMLKSIVYPYAKGGFDCLISLYGEASSDSDLVRTQKYLSTQKSYSTIIIDCPLENLRLLEDIILYSEVIVCSESGVPSIINTVMGLSGTFEGEEHDKLAVFLYNNSKYLLTIDPDPKRFKANMEYVSHLFSLDETEMDWSITPVLGTSRDIAKILNRL